MNLEEDNYLDILNKNDQDSMRKFLLSNGKKKPVSPIYFIKQEKKEENENES